MSHVRALPAVPLVNYWKSCCSLGRAEPSQTWRALGFSPLWCHLKGANCPRETTSREQPRLCCSAPQPEQLLVFVSQLSFGKGASKPLCCRMRMWSSSFHLQELLDVITRINEPTPSTCCGFPELWALFFPAHNRALPACSEGSGFVLGSSSGR